MPELEGEIQVPLPGQTKAVVAPVVVSEDERLIEAYIDNLIKRFGGEVRTCDANA